MDGAVTSAVHNVDIEKSEECESEMASCCSEVPVLGSKGVLNWMEGHNLFEIVKHRIAGGCMREVGEGGITPVMILATT
jgi:hypothetical protein